MFSLRLRHLLVHLTILSEHQIYTRISLKSKCIVIVDDCGIFATFLHCFHLGEFVCFTIYILEISRNVFHKLYEFAFISERAKISKFE